MNSWNQGNKRAHCKERDRDEARGEADDSVMKGFEGTGSVLIIFFYYRGF